ncbi:MAG TPA: DUF427 domain-containing protein [Ornithinimicrobium sp.]|uniref:DUF427 domain-containing protein n=1 Tax=Ornithinimicrobium sp. TaxID=1977084 RepID=UPI002B48AAE9|nr:DUF427 domain-containing protein [Ornithinimicrobium sp.]HKJ11549.1 DUF427 domain-containing protein [Ornithinimicrobium sp.]
MWRDLVAEQPVPPPESVWDYPRPPDVVPSAELVEVHHAGRCIASTSRSLRVRETSHPPTYYLPAQAFSPGVLRAVPGTTFCEFKGVAHYFDLVVIESGDGRTVGPAERAAGSERVAARAAWHYPRTTPGFEALRGHVAVMSGAVDACYVDGERVQPQDGSFYGGWITSRVAGPFKGAPGTRGW